MSVKLYNLSTLPDEPMRRLLTRAKLLAGCGGDVVVKVTRGGYSGKASAHRCDWVAKWSLCHRRETKAGDYKEGRISTDGGYIVIAPCHAPTGRKTVTTGWWSDPLNWAQHFFETAIHEFAHVRDYQVGGRDALPWSSRDLKNGRRPPHDFRPEEIRAINTTDEALDKIRRRRGDIDEMILDLAIQMEAAWVPEK